MRVYVLACCDADGRCFGFLRNDKETVETDGKKLDETNFIKNNLAVYKRKKDTNEICMQINLGHMLLPNGRAYRVTPVRVDL